MTGITDKAVIIDVLRRYGVPVHYETLGKFCRGFADGLPHIKDEYVRKVCATSPDVVRIRPGVYMIRDGRA